MKQIEIEHFAVVTEEKFNELNHFLLKNGIDLGEDDKESYFFLFPDKILKVVNNISKETAKIVVKLNRIGQENHFDEKEVEISPDDVDKSIELFKSMGFTDLMETAQKRHNYLYKEVEFAVKFSKEWKFHVEMEILVDDISKKEAAEKQIFSVAKELGIKIMTKEELEEFCRKIEVDYKNNY